MTHVEPQRRLRSDTNGAIFVEYLISIFPVLLFMLASFQLLELCFASLVVRRSASAAARAAMVVLPDDPMHYGGTPVGSFTGKRRADIYRAAALVLAASPQIKSNYSVDIAAVGDGTGPLKVTVRADFRCLASWVAFICGADGVTRLEASAEQTYQGAPYTFSPPPS